MLRSNFSTALPAKLGDALPTNNSIRMDAATAALIGNLASSPPTLVITRQMHKFLAEISYVPVIPGFDCDLICSENRTKSEFIAVVKK